MITSIDDNPVGNAQEFHSYEGQFPVDEKVRIDFIRDGKSKDAKLVVQQLDVIDGSDLDYRLGGATFEEIPMKQRTQRLRGVVLSELEPRSRVARSGMRPGDVVTGVNRAPVRDLDEFRDLVSEVRGTLYLEVLRKGRDYVVRLD